MNGAWASYTGAEALGKFQCCIWAAQIYEKDQEQRQASQVANCLPWLRWSTIHHPVRTPIHLSLVEHDSHIPTPAVSMTAREMKSSTISLRRDSLSVLTDTPGWVGMWLNTCVISKKAEAPHLAAQLDITCTRSGRASALSHRPLIREALCVTQFSHTRFLSGATVPVYL